MTPVLASCLFAASIAVVPTGPLLIVAVVSFAALTTCLTMFYSLRGQTLPGCGARTGCDAVMQSRWSRVGQVPVTVFGALLHIGIVAAVAMTACDVGVGTGVLQGLAVAAIGAGMWFVALQVLILRAICPYCMLTQALGFVAGGIILGSVGASSAAVAVGGGLAGMMIVGQLVLRPKMVSVRPTALDEFGPRARLAGLAGRIRGTRHR